MKAIKEAYSQGWRTLVQADKYAYDEADLGPETFAQKGVLVRRRDFELVTQDE